MQCLSRVSLAALAASSRGWHPHHDCPRLPALVLLQKDCIRMQPMAHQSHSTDPLTTSSQHSSLQAIIILDLITTYSQTFTFHI
ncbi:hypothetical protein F5148DRAFT_291374 [Russula earlei]|uniref:Uncharacterized protein n=1 Tax=Russula earlei TaxID=71964 RepID=A0ACC0UNR4_9AGAM|nr:hypothetical protein F5148DRAFT_291374 [Russula earlei]